MASAPVRGVPQPAHAPAQELRIGSFNMGVHQGMLADCRVAPGHRRDFARTLNIIIKEHELDVFIGCEIGSHGEGYGGRTRESRIADGKDPGFLSDLLEEQGNPLSDYHLCVRWNYILLYRKRGLLSLSDGEGIRVHEVTFGQFQAFLIISKFMLGANQGTFILGNMHIRTPSNRKAPTVYQKQQILKSAANILEQVKQSMPGNRGTGCYLVMGGDFNLKPPSEVEACLQPVHVIGVPDRWGCVASVNGFSGDAMIYRGGVGEQLPIRGVGASCASFRGVRNDSHDPVVDLLLWTMLWTMRCCCCGLCCGYTSGYAVVDLLWWICNPCTWASLETVSPARARATTCSRAETVPSARNTVVQFARLNLAKTTCKALTCACNVKKIIPAKHPNSGFFQRTVVDTAVAMLVDMCCG